MAGVASLAGCASEDTDYRPVEGAAPGRAYEGYSGYGRVVTTTSKEAQRFFDQGIQLMYGFNHDEAIRSFEAAVRADPDCALAYAFIAFCNGININDPNMSEQRGRQAYAAASAAARLKSRVTPVEAALIEAAEARYAFPPPKERRHLDLAYAEAMERAWHAHGDDSDVGVLYAESLMNLQAWNYWTKSGEPKGRILQVVYALEKVLKQDPTHPGANHLYIHAVEASNHPDRAVASAERLESLVPGSGHLVHMPSHIYIRVGRYSDAVVSNHRAIAADQAYFAKAPPADYYNLYFLHNVHFLTFACMMEGRCAEALDAARRLEQQIPESFLRERTHLADGIMGTRLHTLIRFGRFDDVLAESPPPDFRLASKAVWHYARGISRAARGEVAEARAEQAAFREAVARVPADWSMGNNLLKDVFPIAAAMLEGEILYREGRREEAYSVLRGGVTAEEALVYDEPPGWMLPVRHALGALLMGDGRAADAEQVYREDLRANRGNAWALLGLDQSLRAQGRPEEADRLSAELKAAWARADVNPTSSCFCQPGE